MREKAIELVEKRFARSDVPVLRPGDTVRVHQRIVEGAKERIQVFEGVVLRVKRNGIRTSFTVRKVSFGIGVERIFPLYSPRVEKIEVVRSGRVRRARLYYLRELSGRKARLKGRDIGDRTAAELGFPALGDDSAAEEAGEETAEETQAEAPAGDEKGEGGGEKGEGGEE